MIKPSSGSLYSQLETTHLCLYVVICKYQKHNIKALCVRQKWSIWFSIILSHRYQNRQDKDQLITLILMINSTNFNKYRKQQTKAQFDREQISLRKMPWMKHNIHLNRMYYSHHPLWLRNWVTFRKSIHLG